ncbi:MAG TPA: protein kinase [Gemmatimonadales bacterium]|jgi:eukaryotic-like serine/threonine-protein kinase|nr:protein kinase [Gemmatimonadales bacterium]
MSELRTALADALGPLYRIEREVRPVGEYRLFVATQSQNGSELLVKILPAALSLGINDLQFERAVLLLAERLRHPNLVTPRGAGRAGAFVYHTRPFVPGTTLRAWIGNNGPIPLSRTVEILRNILSGLAHAHSLEIAHGELKPENVLLADEGVLVADAGIASALGKPATARNDMAAVQALTYEMLTGMKPTAGQEPLERSRTLPLWLSEWMRSRWVDAGRALAGIRPPPPSGPPSAQLFA